MIHKEEFFYPSRDKQHKVHAIKWIPDESIGIKCILQIVHGMVEFVDRYDDFARFMAEQGILVVGNDHLGHGETAEKEEDFGYFCEKDGSTVLVRDVHRLKKMVQEQNPGIPYFIMGHSMGSFITRRYIIDYGKGIDGAIIMGTGNKSALTVKAGKMTTKFLACFKGWRFRSNFVNSNAFGSYNKKFEPHRTEHDWICRDEKVVDAYRADRRCQFIFTLNGYYNLFRTLEYIAEPSNLEKIPKQLPLFFVSGMDDPVGDFGKGVQTVFENYQKLGMTELSIKLYKDDRHEIVNELDRKSVYEDIFQWLDSVLQGYLC